MPAPLPAFLLPLVLVLPFLLPRPIALLFRGVRGGLPHAAVVHLPALLEVAGHVLLLDLPDDVAHFDGVADDCVAAGLLLLHDVEHGVLVQQLEVLALAVGDLLLHVVVVVLLPRLRLLLPRQVLLVGLLLLVDLVAPVVHPLHPVQVRPRNQPRLHLDALELVVVLLLQQLLRPLPRPLVDVLLHLLHLPHLLDVLHGARVPHLLVQVVQPHLLLQLIQQATQLRLIHSTTYMCCYIIQALSINPCFLSDSNM